MHDVPTLLTSIYCPRQYVYNFTTKLASSKLLKIMDGLLFIANLKTFTPASYSYVKKGSQKHMGQDNAHIKVLNNDVIMIFSCVTTKSSICTKSIDVFPSRNKGYFFLAQREVLVMWFLKRTNADGPHGCFCSFWNLALPSAAFCCIEQ